MSKKRTCNQCGKQLVAVVYNTRGLKLFYCVNLKCPNAGLLCISEEQLYEITKKNN
jgi:hypothetical protein